MQGAISEDTLSVKHAKVIDYNLHIGTIRFIRKTQFKTENHQKNTYRSGARVLCVLRRTSPPRHVPKGVAPLLQANKCLQGYRKNRFWVARNFFHRDGPPPQKVGLSSQKIPGCGPVSTALDYQHTIGLQPKLYNYMRHACA